VKILVTGGAGFIGSNFITHLMESYPDYQVINLDKLTYAGNPMNLSQVKDSPRYTFIEGDICHRPTVRETISEADVVVNFAAETHVDNSIEEADVFIKTNVMGTNVLLDEARRSTVRRFIQISTDEVYGSIEEGSFTEESPLRPSSPYSAAKAAADLLCAAYSTTHGLPIIIVRSSNNFGPHQHPEKLIPRFITNALENRKLPLYGDGSNVRDWIFVKDNCRAIDLIMHSGKPGEIYNVGGGNEKTNIDITRLIIEKLGKDMSLVDYVEDRPGHDKRYSLNCDKLSALGYSPAYDFVEGLDITIQWYISNPEWCEKARQRTFNV
jgi:dTDP-glucose 4,6-dehydratase